MTFSEQAKEFLSSFKGEDGEYIYRSALADMITKGFGASLLVDMDDLAGFDSDMIKELVADPRHRIPEFEAAAYDALRSINPQYAALLHADRGFRARFHGFLDQTALRDVRVDKIGKLISSSGVVLRASQVQAQPTDAAFECEDGHVTYQKQEDPTTITKPSVCEMLSCRSRNFKLNRELTKFVDIQVLGVQEVPEDLPPGQIPQSFDVVTTEDLINAVRPGDRVDIFGVPEAFPTVNPALGRGSFRILVMCNNILPVGKDPSEVALTPEEEARIKDVASSPEAYESLIKSVAPSILGHGDEKEAILLALAGAPSKHFRDETQVRGSVNVFMVGDPGTSKSQLLKFAAAASPRGIYTSGRLTTAAGLSAAVVKDKSGTMSLEAGVVVLADQGLAAIDEFEHIRPDDRSALHTQMEQSIVPVNKGGFNATLSARTAVVAAANPILGQYNPYKNFTEQIDLPPPLLTRFDLIFLVRDQPTEATDNQLAAHILNLHAKGDIAEAPPVELPLLRKYMAYARRLSPVLTEEAKAKFKELYLKLRKNSGEGQVPITPRTLESMIRLGTARARLLLRSQVTEEDAIAAIRLIEVMMQTVMVDTETGKPGDWGVVMGKSGSWVARFTTGMDVFKRLENASSDRRVSPDELLAELQRALKCDVTEATGVMQTLEREGRIFRPKPDFFRSIG